MSLYAENVIWKRKDNTWAYGMYRRISNSDNANRWNEDEYDSEWDDDFDLEHFSFAFEGFPSSDAAIAHMGRKFPNPDQYSIKEKLSVSDIKYYDEMLRAANNPNFAAELDKKRAKTAAAAYRKTVRDRLRALNIMGGKTYSVSFSEDGPANSPFGCFVSFTGRLEKEGDWLCLKTKMPAGQGRYKAVTRRVWNQKSNTPASNVSQVTEEFSPRWR